MQNGPSFKMSRYRFNFLSPTAANLSSKIASQPQEHVGQRKRYRLIAGKSLRHPLAWRQTIDALVQLMIPVPEQAPMQEPAICHE
jgi:hypothetical protein